MLSVQEQALTGLQQGVQLIQVCVPVSAGESTHPVPIVVLQITEAGPAPMAWSE